MEDDDDDDHPGSTKYYICQNVGHIVIEKQFIGVISTDSNLKIVTFQIKYSVTKVISQAGTPSIANKATQVISLFLSLVLTLCTFNLTYC